MNFVDLIACALSNLWRMKLRAALTITGVIIGVGMLISMLSFGVGIQKNIRDRLERLGLFTTVLVLPSPEPAADAPETRERKLLDDEAVKEIEGIRGVAWVHPFEVFTARLEHGDCSRSVSVQAIPAKMGGWSALQDLAAGRFFSEDEAREAVLRTDILEDLEIENPGDAVGEEVILVTAQNNVTELARKLLRFRKNPLSLLSLKTLGELFSVLNTLDELEKSPFKEMRYPLVIAGVIRRERSEFNIRPVLIPMGTARSMEKLGISNIFDMMSQKASEDGVYATLTVNAEDVHRVPEVVASLNDRDYHTFSFSENFERIQDEFLLFDLFVTAIALVAVVVAALGIVNTLVMSIIERTREIGILKALGAENRHIRILFMAEAAMIGAIGAVGGDLLGWIVTRIGAFVAKAIMTRQGIPGIDVFHTPLWLVMLGIGFGILVSLIAGLYPANRAARVDPIQALRY